MKTALPFALGLAVLLSSGTATAQPPARSPVPEPRPVAAAAGMATLAALPRAPVLASPLPERARQSAPGRPAPPAAIPDPAATPAAAPPVAQPVASIPHAGLAVADNDSLGDLVLAGLGRVLVSPAAAAAAPAPTLGVVEADTVRPAQRPANAAAGTEVVRVAAASAGPVAVSRLAVARSPLPQRRSETERRRHLENLQRAAAVRTQPAPPAVTGQPSGQLCGVRGIEGRTVAPIASRVEGCGVANPVRVTVVDGVRLSEAAIMECDTARALHRWVNTAVKPAIGRTGGGAVELRVAAHYVCRPMNHRRGAQISEHGRGRAIDISGIRLADGTLITVLRDWRHASYGPMLRQMHRAACGIFSTTLGPGSDGMHEDHFHYDTAQRRSSPICR